MTDFDGDDPRQEDYDGREDVPPDFSCDFPDGIDPDEDTDDHEDTDEIAARAALARIHHATRKD
jgi:hypothetical protein